MKILKQSTVKEAGEGTAPLQVYLRVRKNRWAPAEEWVVHTRNLQTGGYFNGFYTKHWAQAEREFNERCDRLNLPWDKKVLCRDCVMCERPFRPDSPRRYRCPSCLANAERERWCPYLTVPGATDAPKERIDE